VRFGPDPRYRVSCGAPGAARDGVVVTLEELVSVLGSSFELLGSALFAAADGPSVPLGV